MKRENTPENTCPSDTQVPGRALFLPSQAMFNPKHLLRVGPEEEGTHIEGAPVSKPGEVSDGQRQQQC